MKIKKEHFIFIPIVFVLLGMILVATEKILVIDNWVYGLIPHNNFLTPIMKFITNFGSVFYIVAGCVLLLIFYKQKKELFHLYGVIILSTIINNIIKILFHRPRPQLMTIMGLANENTFSFPSGHAMASMTFYGFLIYSIYKKDIDLTLKKILIASLSFLIFMIGFSRIYLCVHYFSDVLIGFMCSIIILYYYIQFMKTIETKEEKK